jgi:GTPase involved in cell partitioning and DNA repair
VRFMAWIVFILIREIVRGGKGGKGNMHFATGKERSPRKAEQGQKGEEKQLYLELKSIAEVGLVVRACLYLLE